MTSRITPILPATHILVLADRDWDHPEAGGSGIHLRRHVDCWLDWGYRVSIITGAYAGAAREEHEGSLSIYRMGGRLTVFPLAIWRQWRGLVSDVDAVFEVVNGISFFTPHWLHKPSVVLVHHIHRAMYVSEFGSKGRLAAFLLETLPLRWLYRHSRFVTVSQSSADEMVDGGISATRIQVSYNGLDPSEFRPGERAERPTLLYLGRIKAYKRIELLLDALTRSPNAILDIVGEGDHRRDLEIEVDRRGLSARVNVHGFVSDEQRLALLQRAWINVTASSAEGWGMTVMEAAACGTPSVAFAVGGLREAIVHGETGLLASDSAEFANSIHRVLDDRVLRDRLGRAACVRARGMSWERSAAEKLAVMFESSKENPPHTFAYMAQSHLSPLPA